MEIKIGLLIPQNTSLPYAFSTSAAAIPMAIDRLFKDRVLTPATVNFTILYHFEECEQATAAGLSYELLTNQSVDALIASPCTDGATVEGHLATYYNIPVMMWGSTLVSDLANPILFPTVVNIMPTYADFSKIICDVMEKFKWTTFSFIYQADDNGGCFEFQRDFGESGCGSQRLTRKTSTTRSPTSSNAPGSSFFAFDDIDQKRSFALSLFDAGLHTEDFVYIFPDTDMLLADDQARPFWIDRNSPVDGRDADAEAIGRRGFQLHAEVDASNREAFTYANFSADLDLSQCARGPSTAPLVIQKANVSARRGRMAKAFEFEASMFAPYLYDLFYIYGMSLARTFNQSGPDARFYRNGTLISDNANVGVRSVRLPQGTKA
ncbi:Guanylate cyclase [Aphelenchoides fujianensis]|nr:Guanylate cyclase [Aphelenchoides fujianensis]